MLGEHGVHAARIILAVSAGMRCWAGVGRNWGRWSGRSLDVGGRGGRLAVAAGAELAQDCPRPWERAAAAGPLPLARVQRDYGRILRPFGLAIPAPKPRATAPGRRVGTVLVPTSRQPVLKRRQYAAYSDVVPNIARREHWHRGGRGVSGSSTRTESPYSRKRWTSGKVPAGVAAPRCAATQRFTPLRAVGRCSRAHRVR